MVLASRGTQTLCDEEIWLFVYKGAEEDRIKGWEQEQSRDNRQWKKAVLCIAVLSPWTLKLLDSQNACCGFLWIPEKRHVQIHAGPIGCMDLGMEAMGT